MSKTTDTYSMWAICKNCGTKHITTIPKGKCTSQHKTECPYCGEKTDPRDERFTYTKARNLRADWKKVV